MKQLLFLILFSVTLPLSATHIFGGYISYKLNGSSSCEITVRLLRDNNSAGGGNGILNFGDGTFTESFDVDTEVVNENVSIISFVIDHVYPGPGDYRISYREDNYNASTQNIINAVNQPFIISANLKISVVIENNSSPVLRFFNNQKGLHGIAQIMNTAAYDSDGDSLSFKIKAPNVEGYSYPNDPEFYDDYNTGNQSNTGEPEFSINPVTGDILWDAPGFVGEYIITVNITQWRKINNQWVNIGENEVVQIDLINDGIQEVTISSPASSCFDDESDVQGSFILQGPNDKEYTVEVYTDLEGGLINGEPVNADEIVTYTLSENLQLDITVSPDQTLENFKPYKVIIMVKTDSENHTTGWGFALGCNEFPGNIAPEPIVTSIDEVHNEFLIYPNPTYNKIINISIPRLSDGDKYARILDVRGKTMFEKYISPTVFPLKVDLTNFPPGMYILQLEDFSGKFIIEE